MLRVRSSQLQSRRDYIQRTNHGTTRRLIRTHCHIAADTASPARDPRSWNSFNADLTGTVSRCVKLAAGEYADCIRDLQNINSRDRFWTELLDGNLLPLWIRLLLILTLLHFVAMFTIPDRKPVFLLQSQLSCLLQIRPLLPQKIQRESIKIKMWFLQQQD